MATWSGNELPATTGNVFSLLGRWNQRTPELPEEWSFPGPWPDAEPDYTPKPGQKGYDPSQQMATARMPSPANALKFSPDVGYWMSATPPSLPPDVWGNYLNWLSKGQQPALSREAR